MTARKHVEQQDEELAKEIKKLGSPIVVIALKAQVEETLPSKIYSLKQLYIGKAMEMDKQSQGNHKTGENKVYYL